MLCFQMYQPSMQVLILPVLALASLALLGQGVEVDAGSWLADTWSQAGQASKQVRTVYTWWVDILQLHHLPGQLCPLQRHEGPCLPKDGVLLSQLETC